MRNIELLGVEDITRIFGISQVTAYRWVSLARAGRSRFPAPIGDSKQKLRWLGTDIEAYCQSQHAPQPPVHVASPARQAKKRQERREATRAALERHGIFNTNNRGE